MFWKKKKPKEHVPLGYLEDMSEEQAELLAQFKAWIKKTEITNDERYDDRYLLRFLRARQFKLEKVKEMFQNFIKWRIEYDTDNLIYNFPFNELPEVKTVYFHGYHKTDKQGRPFYIDCPGRLELKRLFEITTEPEIQKYYIREYERLLHVRLPACTKAKGELVQTSFTVMDLNGFRMSMMNKKTYGFIKIASSIAQDNYPEIMGQMYVVNAPLLFTGVWKVVQGFIDEKTRAKIKIKGSKFIEELKEFVDEENIPSFLGGKCTCEDKGGCLESNAGPWIGFDQIEIGGKLIAYPGAGDVASAAKPVSMSAPENAKEEIENEDAQPQSKSAAEAAPGEEGAEGAEELIAKSGAKAGEEPHDYKDV